MYFIIEKIVILKKEIYTRNSMEPQKQMLAGIIEGYPEKILCGIVSRIMKEMEIKNHE